MPTLILGHKQLPRELHVDGADITLIRVPGAKAKNFFEDPRFYQALDDCYEVIVLWLSRNDSHGYPGGRCFDLYWGDAPSPLLV